jgi:hypothetical protein
MANDQISELCLKVKRISSNQKDLLRQQNLDYLFRVNKFGILNNSNNSEPAWSWIVLNMSN